MRLFKEIKDSVLHLVFPHICAGCGSEQLGESNTLCMRCMNELPETCFEMHPGNPVEKKFWGRLPLFAASAQFYFTRESLIQQLIHQLKYTGNKEIGLQLGQLMGQSLEHCGRFRPDALLPLPLFPARERKRGYNQSELLCQGIAEFINVPILKDAVARPHKTETQTRKGRIERWTNIDGKFILHDPASLEGKHILLVDDVITTGATIESCGTEIMKARDVRLSVACLCLAAR
jgi:ComF family protein